MAAFLRVIPGVSPSPSRTVGDSAPAQPAVKKGAAPAAPQPPAVTPPEAPPPSGGPALGLWNDAVGRLREVLPVGRGDVRGLIEGLSHTLAARLDAKGLAAVLDTIERDRNLGPRFGDQIRELKAAGLATLLEEFRHGLPPTKPGP